MMEFLMTFIVGVVVGAIGGIFFYRNNEEEVDPYADKLDEEFDKAKENLKK